MCGYRVRVGGGLLGGLFRKGFRGGPVKWDTPGPVCN